MLDPKVVTDNTVDAGTAIIEVVVGKDDQHSVLSLLATNQDSVATEQLESVHGVVGEGDDGVVVINGIRHHQLVGLLLLLENGGGGVIFILALSTRGIPISRG